MFNFSASTVLHLGVHVATVPAILKPIWGRALHSKKPTRISKSNYVRPQNSAGF